MKKRIQTFQVILFTLIFSLVVGHGVVAQDGIGGVGIILDADPQDARQIMIFSVSYKSPADKVKIRRGDRLLKVDGAEVTGVALAEIAKRIQGPIGSMVTLTVQSAQSGVQDFTLQRAKLSKGPMISLPPPGQAAPAGTFFTPEEKALLKQKILGLQTDEQREKMLNLLTALKDKKITKEAFMKFLKSDFSN